MRVSDLYKVNHECIYLSFRRRLLTAVLSLTTVRCCSSGCLAASTRHSSLYLSPVGVLPARSSADISVEALNDILSPSDSLCFLARGISALSGSDAEISISSADFFRVFGKHLRI